MNNLQRFNAANKTSLKDMLQQAKVERKELIEKLLYNFELVVSNNCEDIFNNFKDELINALNICREKEKEARLFAKPGESERITELYEKIINILISCNIKNTTAIKQIKLYVNEITTFDNRYSFIEPFKTLNNNFKEPEKNTEIKKTTEDKKETKKEPTQRKKPIPKALKTKVWNDNISPDTKIGNCYVCQAKLHFDNFHCGHQIAEKNGGEVKLENLKPVCMLCNTSMGSMNMKEFIETYGFKKPQQFTFTEDSSIADILNQLDKTTKKKFITTLYEKKIASLTYLLD